jgi:hypothetical protein
MLSFKRERVPGEREMQIWETPEEAIGEDARDMTE